MTFDAIIAAGAARAQELESDVSEPEDPQRPQPAPSAPPAQPDRWDDTPPQWGSLPPDNATTEFPAFPGYGYGDVTGPAPVYGSSADPYDPSYVAYPPPQDHPGQAGYAGAPGYAAQPGYADYQGQPGYPGAPWQQPPAPSRRRRTVAWVAGSAVVVAALVVAAVLVFSGSSDSTSGDGAGTAGRTITLPATAAGYSKVNGFDTDTLKQQLGTALQSSGASSGGSTQNAQIGVYSRGSSSIPGLIFVAIALKDVPRLSSQADSIGLDAAVLKFVTGASDRAGGSSPKSVPAGTLGGVMYCATGTISVASVANCGWGDRSYFALTIVVSPTSTDDAAQTTRSFRSAVEH